MAPSSQMFSQGGIRSRDWFSDRLGKGDKTDGDSAIQYALCTQWVRTPPIYLLRALHISMVTSTDRAMVIG